MSFYITTQIEVYGCAVAAMLDSSPFEGLTFDIK